MGLNLNEVSVLHWFQDVEKHKCGYCKQENSSVSNGMWAESLTVDDYQYLIDRGWRRSGKYCYKPIMDETCCPQYTIRNRALEFKLSKSQKRVIKRFNKYLCDGKINKEHKVNVTEEGDIGLSTLIPKEPPGFQINVEAMLLEAKPNDYDDNAPEFTPTCSKIPEEITCSSKEGEQANNVVEKADENQQVKTKNVSIRKGLGADPNKPVCKKAKLMRLERKQQTSANHGMKINKSQTESAVKTLEHFLTEVPADSKHKLQMKVICSDELENSSNVWILNAEYALYEKYQTIVHKDPPLKNSLTGFIRFLVATPLKIKLLEMTRTHPLFEMSAALFAKYQVVVHKERIDECNSKQFAEFLVDSPIKSEKLDGDECEFNFGSYHQQYWINDTLVAVGVIDILPKCVSSVYFFYDPDYSSLTLGTYGSLREIEFTQALHRNVPSIRYYYMGFYIHSCPKMWYKGKLQPSDLLCPETYQWFPIEKCTVKLDSSKYSRLSDDLVAGDSEAASESDVDSIKIIIGYHYTTLRYYKYRKTDRVLYQHIGKLVGKRCAANMLFVCQRM